MRNCDAIRYPQNGRGEKKKKKRQNNKQKTSDFYVTRRQREGEEEKYRIINIKHTHDPFNVNLNESSRWH